MNASLNCPFSNGNVRQVKKLTLDYTNSRVGKLSSMESIIPDVQAFPAECYPPKRKNFRAPFLGPSRTLGTWPASPLHQHMACIKHPTPSPSTRAQGPFPPQGLLSASSRQNAPPPRVPRPSKSRSLSPKSARAKASSAVKAYGLGRGLGPERGQDAREHRFPGRKGGREGTPDCRRPETRPGDGGGSRVSRLTQQRKRLSSEAAIAVSPLPALFPSASDTSPPRAVIPFPSLPILTFPRQGRPAAPEDERQAEVRGSPGSGCLFSGGSLPAPHAGLHTAPHTPLRTALRRLAHAANQCARLGRPIRASRREGKAGLGAGGGRRAGLLASALVGQFSSRARGRGPYFSAFQSAAPLAVFSLIPRPAGPGGEGDRPVRPALGDFYPLSSRGGRPGNGSVMSGGPRQTPFPSWAPKKRVGP